MTEYILDVTCDNGYEFSTDPLPTREKAEGLRDALLYGDGSPEIEMREVER